LSESLHCLVFKCQPSPLFSLAMHGHRILKDGRFFYLHACCFFGVLVVSERISLQKLRFASYFIHTAISSQQLSKNAKKTAKLKMNISASSSGFQGCTRSSGTFLERGRRNKSQKGTKKIAYACIQTCITSTTAQGLTT
jgi:hypothetical protein